MKLFLIGLNILLVLMNGGLAGRAYADGDTTGAILNLVVALLWFLVAMLNALSLKHSKD